MKRICIQDKSNKYRYCTLEGSDTLTFYDGDYRQGGVVLSKEFHDHIDFNYWVALEKHLLMLFENNFEYYKEIKVELEKRKIDISKQVYETKTKYEEYEKNWDYDNIYNAQRDCIHLDFSYDTPQQWLKCKANHKYSLCVENKDCYYRQLKKLEAKED